jgi:ATP-dependent DNA helicase RecG
MRETNDGFRLPKKIFACAGRGIISTRQSGDAGFRVATPAQVNELIGRLRMMPGCCPGP